jgi:hypothetical protein
LQRLVVLTVLSAACCLVAKIIFSAKALFFQTGIVLFSLKLRFISNKNTKNKTGKGESYHVD